PRVVPVLPPCPRVVPVPPLPAVEPHAAATDAATKAARGRKVERCMRRRLACSVPAPPRRSHHAARRRRRRLPVPLPAGCPGVLAADDEVPEDAGSGAARLGGDAYLVGLAVEVVLASRVRAVIAGAAAPGPAAAGGAVGVAGAGGGRAAQRWAA